MRLPLALVVICVLAGPRLAAAQYAPLYRLADIDPGFERVDSSARAIGEAGGRTYYFAYTRTTGGELWSSDGTEAGTRLVRDLNPGTPSTSIYHPGVELGGEFYFIADIEKPSVNNLYTVQRSLWRSDGTAAGTALVVPDLDLGGENNSIDNALTRVGDELFFFGVTDGGMVLYTTDGTEARTEPVRQTPFATVTGYVSHAGAFYFSDGTSLWRSDGTEAGTVVVGAGATSGRMLSAGEYVYFLRWGDLWRSNGVTTSAVTTSGDVDQGWWYGNGPCAVGSRVYYTRLGSAGFMTVASIWWVEGATQSPGAIAAFQLAEQGESLGLAAGAGRLFIQVFRNEMFGLPESELWVSDGTVAGTAQLRTFSGMSSARGGPSALYLLANDGVHGAELWRSDGSVLGTWLVEDVRPGPEGVVGYYGIDLAVLSDRALFSPDDGLHGQEPWLVAPDGASARLLRDIAVEPGTSYPKSAMSDADEVLFLADDEASSVDVWKTDGEVAGTGRVTDDGGEGRRGGEYLGPSTAQRQNGVAIFHDWMGTPVSTADRLWRTDGTAAGTYELIRFPDGGTGGRFTRGIYSLGSAGWLAFQIRDVGTGYPDSVRTDFVRTDGTVAGTTTVALRLRDNFEEVFEDTAHGRLLFSAQGIDDVLGLELWRTDGTVAGTQRIADLWPGSVGSNPRSFEADPVYGVRFVANHPTLGGVLWATNGEPGGESVVATLGSTSAEIERLGDAGPLLALLELPAVGYELGRIIPGAGVELIKDIRPGWESSASRIFAPLVHMGGRLYFGANDGVHGYELWSTDGTTEGTQLVRDLAPGPADGLDNYLHTLLVPVGDRLVFRGCGPEGCEPWVTDGTPAGTHVLMDLWPGSFGSNPRLFARVGSRLLIAADDGSTGRELWALREEAVDDGPLRLGDLDGDGVVDLDDRDLFASAFGRRAGDAEFLIAADMDGDGAVTLVDYQRWVAEYDEPPDSPPPPGVPQIPLLPPLGVLALCAALGAAAIGRSR